jgi:hypothetical protein
MIPSSPVAAPAIDHLERDREQQQPARDAERRQRDAELREQPAAGERKSGEHAQRDQAGARGDAPARRIRHALGQGEENRREADRIATTSSVTNAETSVSTGIGEASRGRPRGSNCRRPDGACEGATCDPYPELGRGRQTCPQAIDKYR